MVSSSGRLALQVSRRGAKDSRCFSQIGRQPSVRWMHETRQQSSPPRLALLTIVEEVRNWAIVIASLVRQQAIIAAAADG